MNVETMAGVNVSLARLALDSISIRNANDIRGNITLPTTLVNYPGVVVDWKSSDSKIVSDTTEGAISAGKVRRPSVGGKPAVVTMTASIKDGKSTTSRDFILTVRPSVRLAQFSRYGMLNFARSNSTAGQQIYMASSVGNDATRWLAVSNGKPILTSSKGMHALRDPSIVRSPDGDKFYLVATDLNVDGTEYGWAGWDWAQSGASRYIETWESTDLRNWSEQRHVLVAPPEAGMAFAPEAIWDPEIGSYVVYWTSSMYHTNSHFSSDKSEPNGRYPLTRNQTLYATTRDFVTFSPARIMSGRPNHGTLDAMIVRDDGDGYYHRFVSDRTSTGIDVRKFATCCPSEDIYQERAKSILAPEDQWELVATCITHKTMKTTYAEAPTAVKANSGDLHGMGYYLFSDQIWAQSPSGEPMEEQLHPYWSSNLASGSWKPIDWIQKPEYDGCHGVMRHGTIFNLTCAEHAALRGADLVSIAIKPPTKVSYIVGETLNTNGLVVLATYTDGVIDENIPEGYGGFSISGFERDLSPGKHTITVSYAVLDVVKAASFEVTFQEK